MLGFIKKGEKISFEALIESVDTDKEFEIFNAYEFYNSLSFSYRITNLDQILLDDKKEISNLFNRRLKSNLISYFFSIFAGIIFIMMPEVNKLFLKSNDFVDVYYEIERKNNDTIIAKVIPIEKNLIILESITNKNEEKVSLDEFKNNYEIIKLKSTEVSDLTTKSKYFGIIILTLTFVGLFFDIRKYVLRFKKVKTK